MIQIDPLCTPTTWHTQHSSARLTRVRTMEGGPFPDPGLGSFISKAVAIQDQTFQASAWLKTSRKSLTARTSNVSDTAKLRRIESANKPNNLKEFLINCFLQEKTWKLASQSELAVSTPASCRRLGYRILLGQRKQGQWDLQTIRKTKKDTCSGSHLNICLILFSPFYLSLPSFMENANTPI